MFLFIQHFVQSANASSAARYNQAPVSDNWILYCAAHRHTHVQWRRYFIDNCATLVFAYLVIFHESRAPVASTLVPVNM